MRKYMVEYLGKMKSEEVDGLPKYFENRVSKWLTEREAFWNGGNLDKRNYEFKIEGFFTRQNGFFNREATLWVVYSLKIFEEG